MVTLSATQPYIAALLVLFSILPFTRPDLSYVVQQVCLYMHDPRYIRTLLTALKRILRYVRGTLDYGLQLHVSSTTQLTAYTDVDWAGCPVTRRSTSGYCVFLGDNLLSLVCVTGKRMAKRSTVDLVEDDEEEDQTRQCSRWTHEEEILVCKCWIEHSENSDIGADRNEDPFWRQIMQDFNNSTIHGTRTKNMLTG
ncbi:ribonuclease H-like domain-containing protein [Tanacetum coccineum]